MEQASKITSKNPQSQTSSSDKPSTGTTTVGEGGGGGMRGRKSQVKSSLTTMTTTTMTTMTKSNSKKERWLLTRKTWRYMTDAVGNLLPVDSKNPASEHVRSTTTTGASAMATSSRASVSVGSSGVGSSTNTSSSAYSGIVSGGRTRGKSSQGTSTGTQSTGTANWSSNSSALVMSPSQMSQFYNNNSSSSANINMSSSQIQAQTSSSTEPGLIALGEQQFHKACNNQNTFLIWTPTPPPKASGPTLRQMKQQVASGKDVRKGTRRSVIRTGEEGEDEYTFGDDGEKYSVEGYFSGEEDPDLSYRDEDDVDEDEEEDEERVLESAMDGDEYDQYADEDDNNDNDIEEEQVTVREGRKSSLASSISSVISGFHFFRPSSSSASAAGMILIPGNVDGDREKKTFASIGIQTDPFPEETLNRLRRQCFLQDNPPPSLPDSPGPMSGQSSSHYNWKFPSPPSAASNMSHVPSTVKSDDSGSASVSGHVLMSTGSSESGHSQHPHHHHYGLLQDSLMTPTTIMDIEQLGYNQSGSGSANNNEFIGKSGIGVGGGASSLSYSHGITPVHENVGENINNSANIPVQTPLQSFTKHHHPLSSTIDNSSTSSFVSSEVPLVPFSSSSSFHGSSSLDTPVTSHTNVSMSPSSTSSIGTVKNVNIPGGRIASTSASSSISSLTTASTTTPTTSTTTTSSTVPVSDNTDKKSEESGYSSSISDTVMRYFRMVRKSSKVDKSDMDRFRTVNYDKSLRNIKSKNVSLEEALDYEKNKAAAAALALANANNPTIPEDTVNSVSNNNNNNTNSNNNNNNNNNSARVQNITNPNSSTTTLTSETIVQQSSPITSSNLNKLQEEFSKGTTPTVGTNTTTTTTAAVATKATTPTTNPSSSPPPPPSSQTPVSSSGNTSVSSSGKKKDKEKDGSSSGKVPGRILPSVGIQAGESLVRFLKLFNRRKTSDFSNASNAPSYCSTESPVDITSPRYSLATTIMSSSGSDTEYSQQQQQHLLQLQQQQQAFYHHTKTLQFQQQQQNRYGEGDMPMSGDGYNFISPRASMSTDPDGPFDEIGSQEFDDVFVYPNNSQMNVHPSSSSSHYKNPSQFFQPFSTSTTNPQYQPQFRQPTSNSNNNNTQSTNNVNNNNNNSYYPIQMRTNLNSNNNDNIQQQQQLGITGGGGVGSDSYSVYHPMPTTTSSSHYSSSSSAYPNNNQTQNYSSGVQGSSQNPSRSHHPSSQYNYPSTNTSSYKTSGNIPSSQQQQHQQQQQQQLQQQQHHYDTHLMSGSSSYGQGQFERESRRSNPNNNKNDNESHLDNFQSSYSISGSGSSRGTKSSSGSHQQQQPSQPPQTFIKSLFSSSNKNKNCERGSESRLSTGSNSNKKESKQRQSQQSIPGGSGGGGGDSSSASSSAGGLSFGGRIGRGSRNSNPNTNPNTNNTNTSSTSSTSTSRTVKDNNDNTENVQYDTTNIMSSSASSSSVPVMQKSKSSSSVLQQQSQNQPSQSSSSRLISKSKLFKSKKQQQLVQQQAQQQQANIPSKTQTTWTPEGKSGQWTSLLSGRQVSLEGTNLPNLSEVECLALQKVALVKLQSMNLGVDVKIPRVRTEKITVSGVKPKRRPYLLKKKALSTGFFDSKREDSGGKEGSSGLVFAIPLSQCVKNDQDRRLAAGASQVEHGPVSPSWDHSIHTKTRKQAASGSKESLFWPEKASNKSGSYSQLYNNDVDISNEDDVFNYGQVPQLVQACVKHLESYGLHTTGIFRVSSSLKRIRQLREEIDSGKEIHFGEDVSPHDVAALLKEFLRDLPEPLLCSDLYEPFLRTQRIRNRKQQMECMQLLVSLLPVSNRDTLHALLSLFAKVVENCTDTRTKTGELITGNKMEAYSLATLIAPNILPCIPVDGGGGIPGGGNVDAVLTKERRDSIDVVNYMIQNYKDLFSVSPETLNQIYLELLETNPEAVENILRAKFPGPCQEPDIETSSVFGDGGSEFGDDYPSSRLLLRKREDILHDGWVSGGRIKMETSIGSSREKIDDRDSDSSSTKSTSRWFRKSRSGEQKNRASSDSGSEKVKGSRKKKECIGGMTECKRASSLDSVNLKDIAGRQKISISTNNSGNNATGSSSSTNNNNIYSSSNSPNSNNNSVRLIESKTTSSSISGDRQRSSSDQGLKIPLDMNRRQSCSPLLESSRTSSGDSGNGVIRASLKITMPLNMDDIPFIDDRKEDRGEAECCSSPIDDSVSTFPYQEPIQARICLGGLPVSSKSGKESGGIQPQQQSSLQVNSSTKTKSSHEDGNSLYSHQQQIPVTSPPQHSSSSHALSVHVTGESLKSSGSSSISSSLAPSVSGLGLIKSKTADFEKLLMVKKPTTSTIVTPKVRIRGSIPSNSQQQQQPDSSTPPSSTTHTSTGKEKERDRELYLATRSADCLDSPTAVSKERVPGDIVKGRRVRDTSDLPTASSSTSLSGGRWKRSEIIASNSSKTRKPDFLP